jgi:Rieske Fe-S protein
LKLLGAGAALPACSSAGGGGAAPEPVGDISAGNVSAVPVGTLRALGSDPVCIARDAGGVYAMTLTCTHQGCNIAASGLISGQTIECGCHGSRFDANGNVTNGPASAPLQHFAVTVDATGNLTIHGEQNVDSGTRLKV